LAGRREVRDEKRIKAKKLRREYIKQKGEFDVKEHLRRHKALIKERKRLFKSGKKEREEIEEEIEKWIKKQKKVKNGEELENDEE